MAKKQSTKPDKRPAGRLEILPEGYEQWLGDIKERVRRAQLRAAVSVNRELVELYWQIGKGLVERQKIHRWGNSVIDRLGEDLQRAFPGLSGFSRTNVYRMRAFYLAYQDLAQIVPQAVGQSSDEGLPESSPRSLGAITWCSSSGSRTRASGSGMPERPWNTAGAGASSASKSRAASSGGRAGP